MRCAACTSDPRRVIFSDGPTGDDGLVMGGFYKLPDESVVFTDGPNGDNGLWLYIPITVDGADETFVFSEIDHTQNWTIHDSDFTSFLESSLHYVIDVASFEQFIFKDISVGWFGKMRWNEQVVINDSMFVLGGNNDLYLRETVNISETVTNDASFDFHFGDAVTMFEFWDTGFAFPTIISDGWIVTDKVVVSKVAATDSRPGAFIPGGALLGSPS